MAWFQSEIGWIRRLASHQLKWVVAVDFPQEEAMVVPIRLLSIDAIISRKS